MIDMVGAALWILSIILPDITFDYHELFKLILVPFMFATSGIINFFTMTQELISTRILMVYHPIGLFSLLLVVLLFMWIFKTQITRIQQFSSLNTI